jgi:hypothetical protein
MPSWRGSISLVWSLRKLRRKPRKPRRPKRRPRAPLRDQLRHRLRPQRRRNLPDQFLCHCAERPRLLRLLPCELLREPRQCPRLLRRVALQRALLQLRPHRLRQLDIRLRIRLRRDRASLLQRRLRDQAHRQRSVQRQPAQPGHQVLQQLRRVRHVLQARRQQARDFPRARARPALTRIVPALPRECALRLLLVKSGRAVRRDRVVRRVPAVLHQDFRSAPEAEDAPETNQSAASGPALQAAFRKLNRESRCMHASLPLRAGGPQSKSDTRRANADFIRFARAPVWEQAAPHTWSRSRRCSGSRAR